MDVNEVYKELLKSKVNAKFSHYVAGNIYYIVQLEAGLYQFPISTITSFDTNDESLKKYELFTLSEDLGITPFSFEIKAATLNRWIKKAITKGDFIKISQ